MQIQQRGEKTRLMPAGLGFNLLALLVVSNNPALALPLASLQCLFTILFVVTFSRSFAQRRRLISAAIVDSP
jgi:hypothetical protein